MTHAPGKTWRRYARKFQALMQAANPQLRPGEIDTLVSELAAVPHLLQEAFHAATIEDATHYASHDLAPHTRQANVESGTARLGWCEQHQLFHRYRQREVIATMTLAQDTMIARLKVATGHERLPLLLWDMVVSRYNGTLSKLLEAHHADLMNARLMYGQKQREVVAAYYETLSDEERFDFYVCGRKAVHASEAAAYETLRDLPASTPGLHNMVVYLCDWCDTYHLGHGDKRNDYTNVNVGKMTVHADFTWYQNFKIAKRYALRNGVDLDVQITHDDVVRAPEVLRHEKYIFAN